MDNLIFARALMGVSFAFHIIYTTIGINPDLLIGQLTIFQAAAPLATVQAYLIVLPFGFLVLLPSLWLLYRTFARDNDEPVQQE